MYELLLEDLAHLASVLEDLIVLIGVNARNSRSATDRVRVVTDRTDMSEVSKREGIRTWEERR